MKEKKYVSSKNVNSIFLTMPKDQCQKLLEGMEKLAEAHPSSNILQGEGEF